MLLLYDKFTCGLAKLGLWFIIACYGSMTVVTLLEVSRRYLFGQSFSWAEELVRFLLIASTFIGGAVAFERGSLVMFDVLMNRFLDKNAKRLNILNNLIILIFASIVFRLGIGYIITPAVLLQKSAGLGIPMFVPYAFIPFGFIMIIVFCIGNIIHTKNGFIRKGAA